ncbi:unnamed protein product [Eruca vesicaria subsp. sativa]|uniref:S-locus glycoprotein n=1 Tax=Eruca vesicaria subsp. sativa TaxID=29727 RepID=A0ABC8KST4_ERUVS|nr:unnamed protein product [Eruca vesicaria subsp. sativa]
MRGVTPNYHHSYTLFFVVLLQFHHVFSTNTLSSNETLTISSNKTLVSPGNVFELGFFKTTTKNSQNGTDRWYLGIWYKTTSERTYVWVANRDNPLHNSIGTLKISHANLVLLNQFNTPVWSTNLTESVTSPVTAELLANGNFVLRDSKTKDLNHFMWQSFDFPVDTLLPEMKLSRNIKPGNDRILTSWKSPTDPSSGDFTFVLEPHNHGLHEFYLLKNEIEVYRTGPWNQNRFNGIPKFQNWSYIANNFIDNNNEEVAYTFHVNNSNIHSRFRMSSTGYLQVITWTKTIPQRNMFWSFPEDACDLYQVCGSYAYCDINTTPNKCNCIKGFVPKNPEAWTLRDATGGCVRSSRLSCGEGDGFVRMSKMKLPETSEARVDKGIGLEECKERCVRDCDCTGFANMDIGSGGSGCVMWIDELVDMRNYVAGGHDLYVKVAAGSRVH